MRIATWNINGIRARIDFVEMWLKERKPDLLGLQELKATEEQIPSEVFEALGYHMISHPQKSWNGVAILAKNPIEIVQKGLPGQENAGSRLIATQLQSGLKFITIYCPNGKSIAHPDYQAKLDWYDSLRSYLSDFYRPSDDIILCGDFNVVPTPLDGWDEDDRQNRIFRSAEERDRVEAIIDFGFYDLYRHLNPNQPGFSWWDYRAGGFPKNHGLRIDFMLGTSSLRKKVRCVIPDKEWRRKVADLTPSDHAPVFADFDMG